MYYMDLSDEEIEVRIKNLSPHQKEKFEIALAQEDDRRRALFIASNYSIEWP
jgi:hypothetical protein